MNSHQEKALEFAHHIMSLGFRVFMAESGTYGFITDEKEERVLGFSFGSGIPSLSGNYSPASRESGTGWLMDTVPSDLKTKEDTHSTLYAHPHFHTGKGWNHFTTVKEYLGIYQKSSKFHEL